jgi:predicted dehydrogenase
MIEKREVLRAGVIGAGVFGGYHAAKYASLPGVVLAGVYDHHRVHAESLAARCGGQVYASEEALIADVDIVSVATPALAHAPSALAALRAGRSVYVEKPLAVRREDALEIAEEAKARGLVVACGFLERAGVAAMGLFDVAERPLLVESTRLGPPSPRNLDVSVVLDLMIHDLDMALALGADGLRGLTARAEGGPEGLADEAWAEAAFELGLVCRFRASRRAADRERTMRLVYPSGEVTVDFLTHRFENTTPFSFDPAFHETPSGKDRLGASMEAFIAAARGEAVRPLASAEDGVRALDLALRVEEAAA